MNPENRTEKQKFQETTLEVQQIELGEIADSLGGGFEYRPENFVEDTSAYDPKVLEWMMYLRSSQKGTVLNPGSEFTIANDNSKTFPWNI